MNAPDSIEIQNKQIEADYDSRPYTSNAHFYSAPGHLRAAAHLYGVSTVPLKNARVLELGCAAGGNLLPFALAYPEAKAVGVDLSSVQVEQGKRVLEDLSVSNMQLHAMSILDITPQFGQFDYIIAHGVFSWVPTEVKHAILRICRENLSEDGIAYISYNTYPGWKAGDLVRDAMMLHSHGAASGDERLQRGKTMLTLLANGLASSNPMGPSISAAAQRLLKQSDYYVGHEYLEAVNTPCYFVEFASAAEEAGLEYVGEAEPNNELPATYGNNVLAHQSLIALGQNKVMRQQYLDFSVGRTFRKSLVVRQGRSRIHPSPDLDRLKDLRFASRCEPVAPEFAQSADVRCYQHRRGGRLRLTGPALFAIVERLCAVWPRSLNFAELSQAVAVACPNEDVSATEALTLDAMKTLFRTGIFHLALEPLGHDGVTPTYPLVSETFAYLHRRNAEPGFAIGCFNVWHDQTPVTMDEAQAWILPRLDGSSSLLQLQAELARALSDGRVPEVRGKSFKGQRNLGSTAQRSIGALMDTLRQVGVVVGKQ